MSQIDKEIIEGLSHGEASPSALEPRRKVRVSEVLEGDTFKLDDGSVIRMQGIDTPEVEDGEPLSGEAAEALTRAIRFRAQDEVEVQVEPGRRDRHGRALAHVYGADGENIGVDLVARGLAEVTDFPQDAGMRAQYEAAEQLARSYHLGKWEEDDGFLEGLNDFFAGVRAGYGFFRREGISSSKRNNWQEAAGWRDERLIEMSGENQPRWQLPSHFTPETLQRAREALDDGESTANRNKDELTDAIAAVEWQRRMEKLFPNVATDDELELQIKQELAVKRKRDLDIIEQNFGGAAFGTMGAYLTDPLVIASFGLGPWTSVSLAAPGWMARLVKLSLKIGAITGATEAAIQPTVLNYKREIDSPYTTEDAYMAVLWAAVGGGLITGAAGAALRPVFSRYTRNPPAVAMRKLAHSYRQGVRAGTIKQTPEADMAARQIEMMARQIERIGGGTNLRKIAHHLHLIDQAGAKIEGGRVSGGIINDQIGAFERLILDTENEIDELVNGGMAEVEAVKALVDATPDGPKKEYLLNRISSEVAGEAPEIIQPGPVKLVDPTAKYSWAEMTLVNHFRGMKRVGRDHAIQIARGMKNRGEIRPIELEMLEDALAQTQSTRFSGDELADMLTRQTKGARWNPILEEGRQYEEHRAQYADNFFPNYHVVSWRVGDLLPDNFESEHFLDAGPDAVFWSRFQDSSDGKQRLIVEIQSDILSEQAGKKRAQRDRSLWKAASKNYFTRMADEEVARAKAEGLDRLLFPSWETVAEVQHFARRGGGAALRRRLDVGNVVDHAGPEEMLMETHEGARRVRGVVIEQRIRTGQGGEVQDYRVRYNPETFDGQWLEPNERVKGSTIRDVDGDTWQLSEVNGNRASAKRVIWDHQTAQVYDLEGVEKRLSEAGNFNDTLFAIHVPDEWGHLERRLIFPGDLSKNEFYLYDMSQVHITRPDKEGRFFPDKFLVVASFRSLNERGKATQAADLLLEFMNNPNVKDIYEDSIFKDQFASIKSHIENYLLASNRREDDGVSSDLFLALSDLSNLFLVNDDLAKNAIKGFFPNKAVLSDFPELQHVTVKTGDREVFISGRDMASKKQKIDLSEERTFDLAASRETGWLEWGRVDTGLGHEIKQYPDFAQTILKQYDKEYKRLIGMAGAREEEVGGRVYASVDLSKASSAPPMFPSSKGFRGKPGAPMRALLNENDPARNVSGPLPDFAVHNSTGKKYLSDEFLAERELELITRIRNLVASKAGAGVDVHFGPIPSGAGAAFFAPPSESMAQGGRALILMTLKQGDLNKAMGLANHEVIHFLRMSGAFSDAEWGILSKQAAKWRKDYNIDARYEHISPGNTELFIEEAVAEAYSAWAAGRLKLDEASGLQKFFERIRELLEGIGLLSRRVAEETWDEIFERVDDGFYEFLPREKPPRRYVDEGSPFKSQGEPGSPIQRFKLNEEEVRAQKASDFRLLQNIAQDIDAAAYTTDQGAWVNWQIMIRDAGSILKDKEVIIDFRDGKEVSGRAEFSTLESKLKDINETVASAEAAHAASEDLYRVQQIARHKLAQKAEQILITERLLKDIKAHRNDIATGYLAKLTKDPTDRSARGYPNVEYEAEAWYGLFMGPLHKLVEKYHTRFLGLYTERKSQEKLLKALWGVDTGDTEFSEMAEVMKKVFELARRVYNNHGGGTAYRPDWGLPMSHSDHLIVKVKKEEWVEFTKGLLDRRKMVDENGFPMDEKGLDVLLGDIYRMMETGGLVKETKNPTPGLSLHSLRRILHFKGPDEWLQYNKRFSERNVFETTKQHLRTMGMDIAMLRIMGPHPDQLHRLVVNMIRHKSVRGKIQGFDRNFKPRERSVNRMINLLDQLFRVTTGEVDRAVMPGLAVRFANMQHFIYSIKLGFAFLSSLGDIPTMSFTAAFNGLPVSKVMRRYLGIMMRDEKAKKMSLRHGHGPMVWLNEVTTQSRYGESSHSTWGRKLSEPVMRAQLLSLHTEAGRMAWSIEMEGFIGQNLRKSWADIDPDLASFFKRYDITKGDWHAIRSSEPEIVDGVPYFSAEKLDNSDVAVKVLRAIAEEKSYAVIIPDNRVRAILTQGTRAGTIPGVIMRILTLFRQFPTGLMTSHLLRYLYIPQRMKRLGYTASFGVSLTLIGAQAVQIKQIARGQDPYAWDDPELWFQGALQGGGLTFFGEFLLSYLWRNPQKLVEQIFGPYFSLVEDIAELTGGNLYEKVSGEETNFVGELADAAQANLPGAGIWYLKLALQRAVFDQLEIMADPKAQARFRRKDRARERITGQESWWKSGDLLPERQPRFPEKEDEGWENIY